MMMKLRTNINRFSNQILASLACNFSGLIAATCSTWLTPKTVWLTSHNGELELTFNQFSWVTSTIEIGILIWVIPCGLLADRFGRKRTILCATPLMLISWVLAILTRSFPCLLIIKFIQGIFKATIITIAPIYVAEISNPKIRGFLGGQFAVFLTFGALASFISGSYLDYQNYLYLLASFPVIFFIIFLYMPESPYYYFMVGDKVKASESFLWLSNDGGTKETSEYHLNELLKIETAVEKEMKNQSGWLDLFATKRDRRAFLIVQFVCITKNCIGIPSFISYCQQMFNATLSDGKNQLIYLTMTQLSILTMLVFTSGCVVSLLLSDNVGRRPLLLWSSLGTTLSNITIFLYIYVYQETDVYLDNSEWIMYLAVIIFCFTSNIGPGQLLFVIQAEFFPANTRSKGGAISGITSALVSFLILKLYQVIADSIGIYINYLIYAIFAFISSIFIYLYIPESAKKPLSDVNAIK